MRRAIRLIFKQQEQVTCVHGTTGPYRTAGGASCNDPDAVVERRYRVLGFWTPWRKR